ncbi:MAG: ABC transporter substrate-binding protein [Deltaproteobacteria bacterium]|nr:MAG: ABC transporter substrate-binding protein [Deltaproteobacteria bacterium]
MNHLLRIIENVNKWVGKVSSYMIVALTVVVTYEVVMRYILKHPTIWVHETSSMLFGAYIVLGGAYTLQRRGHVNLDIVYRRFSGKKKAFLDLITLCVVVLFCGVLLWRGGETAWRSLRTMEHSGSIWNPPVYPIKAVLPTGAFLLLLQGIVNFLRDVLHHER